VRRLALAVALLAACVPAPAVALPSATAARSAPASASTALAQVSFDGAKAHDHLVYLADPARGGRFSGSPGFEDAARYVADRFRDIGLEPLGDGGSFFQQFPMQLVDLAGTPALSRSGVDAKSWTHRTDFTESVGGRAGSGVVEATLAVVGGGSAAGNADDFAGVDVRGRIALVTGPTVTGYQEQIFQRGGRGILVVGEATLKYSYIASFFAETLPVLVITESTANDLLAPANKTVAQVRDAVRAHRANVIGLLRASGPDGARAILIGAHLDGVGTDPNGTVFSAANDNASGPAIAIEVARSLAVHKSELRRSVVFVAFAGEEEGFLGSEAYIARTSSSPGRVESLVAMINLDVIGCCGDTLEASNESKALQDRIAAAAQKNGVTFRGISGGGSDQQSFARKGVPSTLVLWSDYILHTTQDTVAKVDVRHLQRAGDVVTAVALDLARGEGP
jgi:hypothetical protein